MNKESDNTKEEVELSQLVGAIIRDVAKARVQADQYSHFLSEKYKEKEDNGEQLVSFPVPRAEISDVEVKFKFAVSKIKEAPDSTEKKNFFFNKVLEKYTPILTEKYLSLLSAQITLSVPEKTSYQKKTKDHIVQWIKEKFICKESEEQKNLQIQKSGKINDLADALRKIPIPLSNIFEEIQNKTHPIANDIINLYKKNPESFKEHLEIEKPELLAANNTDSGEVSLKFKDSKIKESIILKKDKSKWEEIKNLSWKKQTSNTTNDLLGIAFGNGLWVAFGREGTILTSSDGISWTKQTNPTTHNLFDITYANGLWVAVGYSGSILTSKDGISWTNKTVSSAKMLRRAIYANNMWIVIGYSGTILTSKDGISWTQQTSNTTAYLYQAIYARGIWIVVGQYGTILTSSDGISWTKRNIEVRGQYLNDIAHANDIWVTVGVRGAILTSSDGISWTKQASNTTNWLTYISHNNNMWIICSNKGDILTSSDGISWIKQKSGTTGYLNRAIYSNGMWVVADRHNNIILTSNNGISWTQQKIDTNPRYVAYANGMLVVVGDKGAIFTKKISHIRNFINELYELERKTIETQRNSAIKIQDNLKNDKDIKSTIGEISNEKMKLRKDDQLIVEVNSEELEKIEEEKISEISFKTNIKNYKWLKEEENTFNLIPEE